MRVERMLVGLVVTTAVAAVGCSGGKLAYNLPPAQRIMHPGPGVGGPGPGVIPPAGGYGGPGVYGPGIGRFGDASGGYGAMMGGGVCATEAGVPMGDPNIMQASYTGCADGACEGGVCTAGCCDSGCVDGMCGPGGCGGGGGLLSGMLARHGNFGAAASCSDGGGGGVGMMSTSQIAFLGEDGIQVQWDVSGVGMFDSAALVIPGRQNFYQGAIYRLRVTNIPGRPEATLYPTLEVAPVTPRTDAYLAHAPIPVQFTQEDFDQVMSGNFVTKVIYLPDPEFQELALAGVETLVSTRLDPGVDPIVEADRRGSILAILRMGNKDLEPSITSGSVQVAPESYSPTVIEPTAIEPMSYDAPLRQSRNPARAATADFDNESAAGQSVNDAIEQTDYCYGGASGGYGDAALGTMPMGMPTAGFAPQPVPPHMVAGGPDWGMPITGTPIGLPGPPHIPLGVPAGLQKHVMHNRTRVHIPPPVAKVNMSVKQRPGMNYPRPVTHVHVDETQREPFRLWPFGNPFHGNAGRPFSNGTPTGMAAGYGTGGVPCE